MGSFFPGSQPPSLGVKHALWCLFLSGHKSHHEGPTLMTSSHPCQPPEDPISKYHHTGGVGLQHVNCWGGGAVTFQSIAFTLCKHNARGWGACVSQSVKHLTLDLGTGLDLRVMSSSPMMGSMLGVQPT